DGIRDWSVTGVQTCALPIYPGFHLVRQLDRMEANTDKSAIIGLIEFPECLGTGWDHDFPVPLVVVLNRCDDRSLDSRADGRFKPSDETRARGQGIKLGIPFKHRRLRRTDR